MAPRSANTRPSPAYPAAVDRVIEGFSRLPGIGRRSAERLAFHLLKGDEPAAVELANAIIALKQSVRHCSVCYNLADEDPCRVCADDRRERDTVLVVEQPRDLIALEQTGLYRGLYHVLLGRLSPLDGVGPESLTIDRLLERIDAPAHATRGNPGAVAVREIILGLNPTTEGDGTALYLADVLKNRDIRVSRLARGLPTGWQLEFANLAVLADALTGRRPMD
ncbi:MAG: recombination protein RecR [Phycisphaeraceae bacterium]|nr:recombination protein RecR [Phycisphaeraceae bacterium]